MNSTPEIHHIIDRLDETRNRLRAIEIAVAKLETKMATYSAATGIISGLIIGIIIKFI